MRRALRWITAVGIATAAALGVPSVASAACDTGVAGAIGTTTTFLGCLGEQSYTVPSGVTKVRVKVIGAHGGNRFSAGGRGGQVDAIIDVTAGGTLFVLVGGTGEEGGFNGGGSGVAADTRGGGASDIRTTSCSSSCPGAIASGTLGSRLVVGGGGGGAGPCGTTGGDGGGQANGDGNAGGLCASDAGPAAQGGTQAAGGATGGVQGTGANNSNGGGGGGGLYGGGVASGTRGGAGGSSYGPAGATFATTTTSARVQITPFVATTTTVAPSPASTNYGESVTFTATIDYAGTATGTVQFFDGASALGSPRAVGAGNTATLTTSTLTAGSHTIKTVYSGDTGAEASTSADRPYSVGKQATESTTTSNNNPSMFGESVTFTATVVPSAGSQPIEAGSVQFYDGSTPLGSLRSINTSTGQATFTTSALTVDSHGVSARWVASTNYEATSPSDATSVSQVMDKMDTTTTVDSTSATGLGDSVTFTATVVPQLGTLDGGSVQFFDGADPLGAAVAVDTGTGEATRSTSSLSPGSHTITAVYDGTGNYATSTSPGQGHSVDKGVTDITVASNLTPSVYGNGVTFTATVVPQVGTLDGGSVQFFDGADPLGSPVAIDTATGKATLSTSTLSPGSHTITAKYVGTSTYADSTSPSHAQSIDKGVTDITVASSHAPSTEGETVTFTATVVPQVGTLDGGLVQFYDGADPLGSLVAIDTATGKATLSTSTLSPGSHTITAKYVGTSTYAGSTSPTLTQDVTKVEPPASDPRTPAPPASPPPTTPKPRPRPSVSALHGRAWSWRSQLLLDKDALTIHVSCGPVPCTITVRGEVRIGGRSFGTAARPRPRRVAARHKTVPFAVRSSVELRRRVRSYLLAHPGRRAKMIIKVTFKTATHTQSKTLTVVVRTLSH